MNAPIVLVADDHPMFREALRLAVGRAAPAATIVEVGQLSEAADFARTAERLDLILLDLRMPGAEGFSGVALLHAERPSAPILVVSSADHPDTARLESIEVAIAAALAGERPAPPASDVDPAIDDMARRIATLTPAELRVLVGVLAGRLNKQIAHDLGIAETTVKGHMTVIMRKMNVGNRTQAVLAARALDIELDG